MTDSQLRVDLAQFDRNLAHVRETVSPARLMLVVKDDAYGQGLENIAPRAVQSGVELFGAFDVPTGVRVRELVGMGPRILAWQTCGEALIAQAIDSSIDLGVGDQRFLDRIAEVARHKHATARVQLKIDTGLHRNGVRLESWPGFLAQARTYQDEGLVQVIGVWSHIAEASDDDDDAARAVFEAAVAQAEAAGFALEMRHLAASAASFERPEFRYDVVRIGAFCYGIRSADGPNEEYLGVWPISELRACVTQVRHDGVVIGIGWLDGLPSTLAGRMRVLTPAGPRRLQRVWLDASEIDSWPGASVGDTVTIFGGPQAASATDLAELIDTVGEEILVRVSPLIERVCVA